MEELLKAIQGIKANQIKKHFVMIKDTKVQVSLEEKIEIMRNGENNYILEGGKPVRVEIKTNINAFPVIEDMKADPFWPEERFTWKR